MMFELTDSAKQQLDTHFSEQQEVSPIRVYLAPG
jgi:hypothetical protein